MYVKCDSDRDSPPCPLTMEDQFPVSGYGLVTRCLLISNRVRYPSIWSIRGKGESEARRVGGWGATYDILRTQSLKDIQEKIGKKANVAENSIQPTELSRVLMLTGEPREVG